MQSIQLYIEGQRLEMFQDESVEITQSIRNVRDISKVFTTFTKQFTVPASKVNNRVFEHYYNFDIVDGFDARIRKDAFIELNYLPFKKGKIRLDGVDMRNNKPYAYRITFFGSVVELKDVLGEDKLPSLDDLDINFDYSSSAILDNLTRLDAVDSLSNTQVGISMPLITHSQRLYYDSGVESEQSGNLYYGSKVQGVKHRQLKYAIRLDRIIDAIESKYSQITFASNSFFKDATKDIHKIYMWCHRKTGQVTIEAGSEQKVPFTPTSNPDPVSFNFDPAGDLLVEVDPSANETLRFIATATSNGNYDLIIKKNGVIDRVYENVSGTISPTYSTANFEIGDKFAAFFRTYDETITFSDIKWINFADNSPQQTSNNSTTLTYFSSYKFNIAQNIPEMKIIDFLSNLFKLFNLVAYVQDDGTIQVEPLDTYYARGRSQDITKYTDITKSQVNSALPYRKIFFKYKDTKTILAEQHLQEISQIEWGGVEYSSDDQLDGDIYTVEPTFHHAKYEKLLDSSNLSNDTGVQVGYFVNSNEEAYQGDPLLLYINAQSPNVDVSFVANSFRIQISSSQTINMPSNTEDIDDETSNNIHFNPELSEYTLSSSTQTLFKRFYENYILNVFDAKNRITKVSAILPLSKTIDIQLYDTVIIAGKKYRINSMKTNLKNGRTEFELINYYD